MLRPHCFALLIITGVCCNKPDKKTLFTLAEDSNINFTNQLSETRDFNVFKYRNFYNGGGVATGDINNDGFADVFFTANQGSNKLYLNKGDFQFEDISEKAGFTKKKQWSTGVVFVDINNDGWLDIYVCNAGNMMEPQLRRNQLFINNHDLSFTERAADYGLDNDGYTTQASFFDYDLDGDLDCFMVNNSPIPVNTLNYANMRDKPENEWGVKDFLKGGGDHLYRNDNAGTPASVRTDHPGGRKIHSGGDGDGSVGRGKFIEVTKEAGIHGGLISLGLGVNVSDVNNDGYPDIYVSNDFFERDYLYINQKNGTFKDELENRVRHTSLSSMGADIQDINNDGYPDIFTTDMLPADDYRLKANTSFDNYDVYTLKQKQGFYNQFTQNTLLVNNGQGNYWETAYYSGVAASDWSWGALMFDADNDGLSDIYVCNGIYRDVTDQDFIDFFSSDIIRQMIITGKKEDISNIINKMPSTPIPNYAFRNTGNLRFKNVITDWGFSTPSFSNGAAYADLDNDGDLDMVVNNVNQKAFVYRNNSESFYKNNYLSFSLSYKGLNPFAIGSTIRVFGKSGVISREVIPSRGFQSSVEYKQTIGLGTSPVDSVTITWPDKSVTTILKPALNTLHQIQYDSVKTKKDAVTLATVIPFFEQVQTNFDRHAEDDYVDFYYERNIPFMLSRQGPKAAVADINGDGLEDIYIGGAKDQAGQLYLQAVNGFVKKACPDFVAFSFNDVTAARFFDCDGDGDMDLFTGGGGNFSNTGFQNQLFINDGKGNFALKRGALPISNTNCGAVVTFDYDGDGDIDLFTGSRSAPQDYGVTPVSFLLKNDGKGNFKDVTKQEGAALSLAGMVTAAVYEDINNDGKKDLIITGEWMTPAAFTWNGKNFESLKMTGLENEWGWWQALEVTDIDNDGDMDLVLGNLGENFYLQPGSNSPVKLWMKDFDHNGTAEKIFTRTVNGRDVPVFTKREITDQVPSLKKQNLKHHDYASKSVQDIFGDDLKDATVKLVNTAATCIAYNDGKGNFTTKALPMRAQLSSVNAITILDINNDGYKDIVTAGNFTSMLPQFCALDANNGWVLINNKGIFSVMNDAASGLNLVGETRDIAVINNKEQRSLLFLQSNRVPVLYKVTIPKKQTK